MCGPDQSPNRDDEAEAARRPAWQSVRRATWAMTFSLVALVTVGNLAIISASLSVQWLNPVTRDELEGVPNFAVVDGKLWRGAVPSPTGYRSLREAGVVGIIDLRAEDDLDLRGGLRSELGFRVVSIPVRDGQTPTARAVDQFLATVRTSSGPVFVHCGAGVGRTGTMTAAYLVATGQADRGETLRRTLAAGPPSLEQIAFVANLDDGHVHPPSRAVVAASRLLDAPRRLLSRLRT